MKTEEKPKLITPAKLDHIMMACRETLLEAIEQVPRMDADDPAALAVYERCVEDAKDIEQALKSDAGRDCNTPDTFDIDDPTDQLRLLDQPGSLLERAARRAYFHAVEWRCCVSACGTDGVLDSLDRLELALTRLVMLRLHGLVKHEDV